MQENESLAFHRRQLFLLTDFIKLISARIKCARGEPMVRSIEQAIVTSDRVALNAIVVEEPHVGPELLAAHGLAQQ